MFKGYKEVKIVLVSMAMVLGCSQSNPSEVKIDSAHSIGLHGVITDGFIVTSSESESQRAREIETQIRYTIGQFNGENGVGDLNRLEVSVGEATELEDGIFQVSLCCRTSCSLAPGKPVSPKL